MTLFDYTKIFNGRTKTIQVINMLIMGIWLINLILIGINVLPDPVVKINVSLLVLNLTAVVFGVLSIYTKGQQKYGFKAGSLLLAGIFHIVTASIYIVNYPPMRVGLLQECMFAVVFFLSGVYALTKEEEYVKHQNKDI